MKLPSIIYGTAWKGAETSRLVCAAVRSGFRAIDTAAQPKHYNESGVGDGLRLARVPRSELYIQTKFTPMPGQDLSRLPYAENATIEEQVRQSLAKSLQNLQTHYIDALILHSPMSSIMNTIAVWRVFEEAVDMGVVRHLGISNCYDLRQLETIYTQAKIKPRILQNRFYAQSGFDTNIRIFCKKHGIQYESFWTLSANVQAISSPEFRNIANALSLTPAQAMFAFVRSLGIVPLSGTTSEIHMRDDLSIVKDCDANIGSVLEAGSREAMARILRVPLNEV